MNSKLFAYVLILLLAGALLLAGCTSLPQGNNPANTGTPTNTPATVQENLLVYAGAGIKAPMDEIGPLFTQKYGIAVQYTYAGSGVLITQMNLTRKGDVFIPGSTNEYNNAKNQSLVGPYQLIAYHVPVIAVQHGNPKNITSLQDFTRPGLKIALGDVNATAIGKAGAKLFKKMNITEAVEKNVVTRTPTINELTTIMNMGQADASLLTLDQINEETMDAIPVPPTEALIVPIGVTTFTTQQKAAQQFADFVASDEGKAVFARHGFPVYPDPVYAEVNP